MRSRLGKPEQGRAVVAISCMNSCVAFPARSFRPFPNADVCPAAICLNVRKLHARRTLPSGSPAFCRRPLSAGCEELTEVSKSDDFTGEVRQSDAPPNSFGGFCNPPNGQARISPHRLCQPGDNAARAWLPRLGCRCTSLRRLVPKGRPWRSCSNAGPGPKAPSRPRRRSPAAEGQPPLTRTGYPACRVVRPYPDSTPPGWDAGAKCGLTDFAFPWYSRTG